MPIPKKKTTISQWNRSTRVKEGKRVPAKKPFFERTIQGISKVVDPLRKQYPFFKGIWIFGTVPDRIHNDLDIIIIMDELAYSFPGNIRTHIAEQLTKELGLKKVDWLTVDTKTAQQDLTRIREQIELWNPDISCFYGDPLIRRLLKNALQKTRKVKGYWKKYDKGMLKQIIEERKKERIKK